MTRLHCAVLLFLVAIGCVQPRPPLTADWVANNLSVSKGDPYRQTATTYRTPKIRSYNNQYGGEHVANLAHWGGSQYALEVVMQAKTWKFLEHAATQTGQRLPVEVRDRVVGSGGWVSEQLHVALSKDFLLRNKNGFSVKLWGKRGELLVEVPGQYVQGLLAGVQ